MTSWPRSTISRIDERVTALPDDALNERVLGRPGGLTDEGKLISALHRAHTRAHYEGTDEVRQSVALLVALALAHPFIDGNKCTALATVAVFWTLNGWTFVGDFLDLAQWLERLVANHATRTTEAAALEDWLRERLRLPGA